MCDRREITASKSVPVRLQVLAGGEIVAAWTREDAAAAKLMGYITSAWAPSSTQAQYAA